MENLQNLSTEKITNDLLPQKFGRRGKIWTAGLIVICCIGGFAYVKQLREGLDSNPHGRLCFLGNLYFQLCFFCGGKLSGVTYHCNFSAFRCALAYPTNTHSRNYRRVQYYFCGSHHRCRYGAPG